MRCIYCFLLIFFSCLPHTLPAFELSAKAQISLITGSAGTELYAIFGHSAIRVYDPFYGLDVMYNYGTFDFNTPNFLLKFGQGRLLYSLSKENYPRFLYYYQAEGRSVEEQILDLAKEDKQKIFAFLENNAKPQNRDYKYDFFYDNCATRIRDVLSKVLGNRLSWKIDKEAKQKTFKQLVTPYLKDAWVHYGIYLILGLRSDYYATPAQTMFLPDYLSEAVGKATLETSGKASLLAKPKTQALQIMVNKPQQSFFTPLLVMSLIGLGLGGLTFWEMKRGIRLRGVDFGLFFITGLAGCLFLIMWVATDHLATHINLNMLWAFPPHVVISFWLLRRRVGKLLKWYFSGFAIFQLLLVIDWFVLPQEMHIAMLPIILALIVRAFGIYRYVAREHNPTT